jgi:hypothetical protein
MADGREIDVDIIFYQGTSGTLTYSYSIIAFPSNP